MKMFFRALLISLVFIVLCGVVYPLAMTGISQLFFHTKANGSIAQYDGKPVGSELLGQAFTDMRFFHGRVSAYNYNTYKAEDKIPDKDGKTAYTGVGSGSANLAPSNPVLVDRVKKDIDEFLKSHPGTKAEDIPTDLLTSSGSGLDPDISTQAAKIQIPALSKATGISEADLNKIVADNTERYTFDIFGEPRVNILKANLEIAKTLKLSVK